MKGVLDPQGFQTLGVESAYPLPGLPAAARLWTKSDRDREQMPVTHPPIGRCLGMGLTVKPLALRLEKEGRQAVFQRRLLIAGSGAKVTRMAFFIGKNRAAGEKQGRSASPPGIPPGESSSRHNPVLAVTPLVTFCTPKRFHFAQKTRPFHKVQDGDSAVLMAHGTPGFSLPPGPTAGWPSAILGK